jgi:hypothetical protein
LHWFQRDSYFKAPARLSSALHIFEMARSETAPIYPPNEGAHVKQVDDVIALANATVAKAERCRQEAQATIEKEPNRYAELSGQPSGWCVVTQSGFWSRKYHDRYEESRLRECIERGDRVLLAVGIVAKRDVALNSSNHVASVTVCEPCKLAEDKLALITTRAKIHATFALSN